MPGNKHFTLLPQSINSWTAFIPPQNNTGVKEKAKNRTFVPEGQSMSVRMWDR